MNPLTGIIKKLEADIFFKTSIKEIELDTLAEIYYRYMHDYIGYSEKDICDKYFKNYVDFYKVKIGFTVFVDIFKIHNYRII